MTKRCDQELLRVLDPSWWVRSGTGYQQQGGRARLSRLNDRRGWALYVDGVYRGDWALLSTAKKRAREISLEDESRGGVR